MKRLGTRWENVVRFAKTHRLTVFANALWKQETEVHWSLVYPRPAPYQAHPKRDTEKKKWHEV